MSQDWVADLYTTGTVGDTTLSNMELMFATLRSSFSGATAPSNPVDGNLYYDTGSDLLKAYRSAAWAGVLVGSAAFKMWVYLDAAEDGWSIDASSVTDRVLAFKGGSQAYNRTGGGNAGTWTISGLGSTGAGTSHSHGNGSLAGPVHSHGFTVNENIVQDAWPAQSCLISITSSGSGGAVTGSTANESAHTHPGSSGNGVWRPAGAVGTLQYPDMS